MLYSKHSFILLDFLNSLFKSLRDNEYFKVKRFNSFAPIRNNCNVKFYINAEGYYSDLCDNLQLAQNEILITDWWLSPQLFLKRPRSKYPDSRLDSILKLCAERGVKIVIIIYKEIAGTICNNSKYVKEYLESLHSNIFVFRHPNTLISFWSHHEKMCIIDKRIGFLGGIDLCYGRFENNNYYLFDKAGDNEDFPYIDYSNPRIIDYGNVEDWKRKGVNDENCRMPWRDIGISTTNTKDLIRHFVQYLEFVKDKIVEDEKNSKFNFLSKVGNSSEFNALINKDIALKDNNENYFNKLKNKFNKKSEKEIVVYNNDTNLKSEKKKIDKIEIDFNEDFNKYDEEFSSNCEINGRFINDGIFYDTQMCRSSSIWSCNIERTEKSIYNAYVGLIQQAEEYVYIENQFFISNLAGSDVVNDIANEICKKIISKFKKNEPFLVILLIPLLPGFEGDILEKNGELLRIQLGWELLTLSKSNNSIINKLKKEMNDEQINNYFKVFGLRNHDINPKTNTPTTEIVYIHSKLMIVDDNTVVIGSANINDRSMLGERDSELIMVVQQTDKNSKEEIIKFRKEVLGSLFHYDFKNLLNASAWAEVERQCDINASFYREVFGAYPDSTQKTFADIIRSQKMRKLNKYEELKQGVKGFAVKWPLNFLENEAEIMGKHFDFGLFILPNNVFT